MNRRPRKRSISARARELNADDAAVMLLMALNDHLVTVNKLTVIAKLLGAGREADAVIQKWASECSAL